MGFYGDGNTWRAYSCCFCWSVDGSSPRLKQSLDAISFSFYNLLSIFKGESFDLRDLCLLCRWLKYVEIYYFRFLNFMSERCGGMDVDR